MEGKKEKRILVSGLCVMLLGMSLFTGCGNNVSSTHTGKHPDQNGIIEHEIIENEMTEEGAEPTETDADGASSLQSSTGGEAGTAGEESGNRQANAASGRQKSGKNITELLASWDWDYGAVTLEQVTEALDENDIHYAGYYNVSGERLDMTLEDGTSLIFFEARTWESRENYQRTRNYELMMKGTDFNKNGFQEHYLNEYDVTMDEFIYPNLSEEVFDEDAFWKYSQTELSIARNQLFAKYGRKFQDPFLSALFSVKTWYEPKYEGREFDGRQEEFLSDVELTNLKSVLKMEERRCYRKSGDGNYETARGILSGSWIDVDGDGQEEQILYDKRAQEGMDIVTLKIREEGLTVEDAAAVVYEGISAHEYCYILSMDGIRNQIVIADDGYSADYMAEFYEYGEARITELGNITAEIRTLKVLPDTLKAQVETFHIQCEPIEFTYVIENGTLKQLEQDYYEYRGNSAEALYEIPLMKEKGSTETAVTLMPGDKVRILGGDLSEWVQLEKESTGEKGWLKVTHPGECYLPDGVIQCSLCFDGLTFYG